MSKKKSTSKGISFQALGMPVTAFIKQNNQPFILGVAGGSGSGKTFFARDLMNALNEITPGSCEIIFQDNFYFDQSARFDGDGGSVNFDHPDSIDFTLLANCLKKLKNGHDTAIPIYDFASHSRKKEQLQVSMRPIFIVDGILIFHSESVRPIFDHLIYFDTAEQLRLSRRMDRDIKERGRTPEGVHKQFHRQVKPMHDQFVEPSKKFAHLIFIDQGLYQDVLREYVAKLAQLL